MIRRITNFKKSDEFRSQIHQLIPGGAHTYSKGDDQFPERSPAAIDYGKGSHVWDIDGNEYVVDRSSTKYIKKSKGIETTEAKTDVEFTAEAEGLLTGLDRSDTDKVIRRFVGSIDDFLLTSMSSQFNSLAFISEGSTNRKAILAKFLDLDIFETKHKLAKSDASDIKAVLKKLEGKDFDAEIKAAKDSMANCNTLILEKKNVAATIERELRTKREELIVQIEAILPFTDVKAAKNAFRELSRSWEKIGITHRDKRAAFDARVAKVEETIKTAEAEIWRKTDPAAKARAADVVKQLSDSIANYEKVAAKSQAAGNAKKAQEALDSAAARKVWLAEAEKSLAEFN